MTIKGITFKIHDANQGPDYHLKLFLPAPLEIVEEALCDVISEALRNWLDQHGRPEIKL